MANKEHKNGYWTKERCAIEALKYHRCTDFRKGNQAAYFKVRKSGWWSELCSHFDKKHFWTIDECFDAAKKCNSRKEFRHRYSAAYNILCKNNLANLACSHMHKIGDKLHRAIYAFEFSDNFAYIGLTFNPSKRKWQHITGQGNTAVYQHLQMTESSYTSKVLTDFLEVEEAQKKESEFIEKYRSQGWIILNTKNAGDLGGHESNWNYETLKQEALKYQTKTDFKKSNSVAYDNARKQGIIDEICAHMKIKRRRWTDETAILEAKKYKNRNEMQEHNYPAFVYIYRHNLVDIAFAHMETTQKWTIDDAKEEALRFDTRSLFHKQSPYAYHLLWNNGLLDSACSHMKICREDWTIDKIREIALKYNNIKDFKKYDMKAYMAAFKYKCLKDVTSHMKRLVQPKGFYTLEKCKEEALKYQTKKDFMLGSPRFYDAAHRFKWIDLCCEHMTKSNGNNFSKKEKWNHNNIIEAALKYDSKDEFRKYNYAAYIAANKHKMIKELEQLWKSH